jgi:hypothetical protein
MVTTMDNDTIKINTRYGVIRLKAESDIISWECSEPRCSGIVPQPSGWGIRYERKTPEQKALWHEFMSEIESRVQIEEKEKHHANSTTGA